MNSMLGLFLILVFLGIAFGYLWLILYLLAGFFHECCLWKGALAAVLIAVGWAIV